MTRRTISALALLVLCAFAHAKPQIQSVDAGWSDTLPVGAWAPVRVTIGEDEQPTSGMLHVTINAGSRGAVFHAVRPFVVVPGSPVTYEIPVRAPIGAFEPYGEPPVVNVRLESPTFATYDRWSSFPRNSNVPLVLVDPGFNEYDGVFIVTSSSNPGVRMPRAGTHVDYRRNSVVYTTPNAGGSENNDYRNAWQLLHGFDIDVSQLPRSWRLLSSARAVVMDTALLPSITGARREALVHHVRDGAELLLVGDPTLIDAEFRPTDASAGSVPVVLESGSVFERDAWAMGFGRVSSLPIAPALFTSDEGETFELWCKLLDIEPAEHEDPYAYRYYSGDAEEPGESVVNRIGETFQNIQPPSAWWLLAFAVFVAIFIGPIDRVLLKRTKKLHLAWASGLFWIALASLLAALAPDVLRSGEPHAGMIETWDIAADGTTSGERTILILSGGRHRADVTPPEGATGVWQHRLSGRTTGSGLFGAVTRVGEGATLPVQSMRPLSVFAMRERTDAAPPMSARFEFNEEGDPIAIVDAPSDHAVLGAYLVAGDQRFPGQWWNATDRRSLHIRFNAPPSDADSIHEYTPFVSAPSQARARSMLRDGHAVLHLRLSRNGETTIPGAPDDASITTNELWLRLSVTIPDAIQDALNDL